MLPAGRKSGWRPWPLRELFLQRSRGWIRQILSESLLLWPNKDCFKSYVILMSCLPECSPQWGPPPGHDYVHDVPGCCQSSPTAFSIETIDSSLLFPSSIQHNLLFYFSHHKCYIGELYYMNIIMIRGILIL